MARSTAVKRRTVYLSEMMELLGIEAGVAEPCWGLRYAAAFHRCEACRCRQACRDWVDGRQAPATLAPRFCPNADIFLELAVDQPSSGVDVVRASEVALRRAGHDRAPAARRAA